MDDYNNDVTVVVPMLMYTCIVVEVTCLMVVVVVCLTTIQIQLLISDIRILHEIDQNGSIKCFTIRYY